MNIGLVWLVFEINFKTNKRMSIEFIDTRVIYIYDDNKN